MSTVGQPWYQFPIGSTYGEQDSEGAYWQPDVNVEAPGSYPITNLLPMTVTNVQQTDWGQTVVTGQLDTPLNSLASFQFYEHLSSAAVSVGQHVGTGDLIGYNNPAGSVPIGYGLYSGPIYGSGSAWQTLQQDLAPTGAGLLKADGIINAFAGNAALPLSDQQGSGNNSLTLNLKPIGLYALGTTMLLLGFYALFQTQINSGLKKIAGDAKKAAEVAAV